MRKMRKNGYAWDENEILLQCTMAIPPKKKLEWLNRMRELLVKCSTERTRRIRSKIRQEGHA